MSNFVKRRTAIGWDWFMETDEESSWVSHMVKERIESLEAENAKLREFATETWELLTCNEPAFVWKGLQEKAHELGIEV